MRHAVTSVSNGGKGKAESHCSFIYGLGFGECGLTFGMVWDADKMKQVHTCGLAFLILRRSDSTMLGEHDVHAVDVVPSQERLQNMPLNRSIW